MPKNFDSRNFNFKREMPQDKRIVSPLSKAINIEHFDLNAMTGTPGSLKASADQPKSIIQQALRHVKSELAGFGASEPADFIPDPLVFETSAGTKVVNLHQQYLGVPVFQMTRNVQFAAYKAMPESEGDSIPPPKDMDIAPAMDLLKAVVLAVENVKSVMNEEDDGHAHDPASLLPDGADANAAGFAAFKAAPIELDISGYAPRYVYNFSDAAQHSVVGWVQKDDVFNVLPQPAPLGAYIAANLTVFYQGPDTRLGWEMLITLPEQIDQYRVIWPADDADATEPLYRHQTAKSLKAQGKVYHFSPRNGNTQPVDFPLNRSLYPIESKFARPLTDTQFPRDWCDTTDAVGNNTITTRGNTPASFRGTQQNGQLFYHAQDPLGDDQKLVNIFYFCNYMHDFFYLLGFDEENGNFQRKNFTGRGTEGDAVRARMHPGFLSDIANMLTPADGTSPTMNLGVWPQTGRHTGFDADVVFHEFCHGVTNRLVGGRFNNSSLEQPQSAAMGEGWGDYFALTIQNFDKDIATERRVAGDWLLNRSSGLRGFPYGPRDANLEPDPMRRFPDSFGMLGRGRYNEVHNNGEIWCAALMHMNRLIGTRLNNYKLGHQLGWQLVVDGLKLTRANPSFLDARNGIMKALDDLKASRRVTEVEYKKLRLAAWEAFTEFGMGVNAFCPNASLLDIIESFDLPMDI